MNRMKLLGAAGLAASLMAAPAFAQNAAPVTPAAPAATPPAVGTPAPANGTATAMNQASDGTNGMYANVGQGGYAADQAFIHGANANTNPSADAKDADLRPSQRNPVLADNGSARASKVIGTEVYNTDNQKLGSVDDILIGKNGVFAVLSTNQKKVTVPFDSLKLGDAKNNGDDKLVLPNETQAKLNTQLEFHYDASNYQSWQAAHNKSANAVTGNTTGVLGNNHNPKNPG